MAQKVNKLEFSLNSLTIPTDIGGLGNRTVVAFNCTQVTPLVTSSSDRFGGGVQGRFLKDFAPLGVTDEDELRGARSISVFHHLMMAATAGVAAQGIAIFFDFITTLGGAALATPIDPITNTRHFRLRATIKRALTLAEFGRTTTAGIAYAQRQHTIEV